MAITFPYFGNTKYFKLAIKLFKLGMYSNVKVVIQDDINLVNYAIKKSNILDNYAPHVGNDIINEIKKQNNFHFFTNVNEWIKEMSEMDFVIGTRIHGTIIGLLAGTPSMCLAIDSRTKELCEIMHIPYLDVINNPDIHIPENLTELVKFIKDHYTFDPNKMATHIDYMKKSYDDIFLNNM